MLGGAAASASVANTVQPTGRTARLSRPSRAAVGATEWFKSHKMSPIANASSTCMNKRYNAVSTTAATPRRSIGYRPYHSHEEHQALTPGEPVVLDIEIWPTCIVVPAGYTLALNIRGRDYDHGLVTRDSPTRPIR